jgi:Flp pilus assembly protein TadG
MEMGMIGSTKTSRLKELLLGSSGQEIAEAAIVLPLLFMLLFGIYWFGRAFNIYGTINHAAREGARVGMVSNCASCGNLPATDAQIAAAVTQALQASRLDPNQVQAYTPVPSPGACPGFTGSSACNSLTNNVTICRPVQINTGASSGTPVCGVTVSFQYPYQFWFPFTSLNMQRIYLKASVQADGEE